MSQIIQTQGLTKTYPGVVALDHVDFELESGEVHILFGENGAGKSTLISMLAGSNEPSGGSIKLDGQAVQFRSVKEAQNHGIYTVFQEFSLIPTMSVAENLFLGNEPKNGPFIQRGQMKKSAQKILDELGFDVNAGRMVSQLSRAQAQMVEIAKALMGEAKVLILDEPTASLTDKEVVQLFEFVNSLKNRGVGVVYISHRMQEFEQIGDRITILRDGKKITTLNQKDTNHDELVALMTGRDLSEIYPNISKQNGDIVLRTHKLSRVGVKKVDLEIRKGEVLGVAGLVGSGKSRLFRLIMGLGRCLSGDVEFNGENVTNASTSKMMAKGAHYLSPDRKEEGLDLAKTSRDNIAIDLIMRERARGKKLTRWPSIYSETDTISDRVELHDGYRQKLISQLSGGNQQKALFGKCFADEYELYIFDEPTVGVDMGTRAALYLQIKALAEAGKAVVLISSDLQEVMNISHRLMVMNAGKVTGIIDQADIEEERILQLFFKE